MQLETASANNQFILVKYLQNYSKNSIAQKQFGYAKRTANWKAMIFGNKFWAIVITSS